MASKKTWIIFSLFIALALSVAPNVSAKKFWDSNSFTLLMGNDYKVGDESRWVLTYEHVSGHSWGDLFLFYDRLDSDNGDLETYGEISPRLAIFNQSAKDDQFLGKVYIAATMEMGAYVQSSGGFSNAATNYLIGLGTDLSIPNFAYVQVNLYKRNNDKGESSWQLTPVWGLPFTLGKATFLYDGFADWVAATDNSSASLNFTSQLKLDVGAYWDNPKAFYIGVEYNYWVNKFGISGVDERNPNLLLKAHF